MNLKILTSITTIGLFVLVGTVNAQSVHIDRAADPASFSVSEPTEAISSGKVLADFQVSPTSQIEQTQDYKLNTDTLQLDNQESKVLRLKHKIVSLSNPVYQLLEYFEAKGALGFLPQAKPYTKVYIADLLSTLATNDQLSEKDLKIVNRYLADITEDTYGLTIYKQASKNTFALAGFSADVSVRAGMGDNGTWSTSLIGEPYISCDLGEHWTFTAGMGLAVERLTPDLFYQSYTKDQQVVFPYESIGYSQLPYQFNFETMWAHVLADATSGEGKPVKDELTAGMIYHTELNGSWFDGAVQVNINNQRRAWGHDEDNLVLSSTARRFPGIELKIQPAKWIRYSYLAGSLFSYANQSSNYRKQIYGYDLGEVQKMFSYQLLEIIPTPWLQISGGGGNIWSKRLELAYLVPFVMPHFTQIDVGDNDNLSMYFDVATMIPKVGKVWGGFWVDEFSFTTSGNLLKKPRNRYAWQVGWKTSILSGLIPGTTSTMKYTRLTPFAYTHYPETEFNTFTTGRAMDMTYTHDEFNLGYYLPPNSGEFQWKLTNVAVPDLVLSLDNRLIMHGTNDLASTNVYQIYGDVYRHQIGSDILKYPLLNFTKDGIYDWTMQSEFKFDWKIRNSGLVNYYRLVGSLGYSKTWWESNESQVISPESKSLFTGSIGIVVEM
jgi:hypothetical protein